MRGEVLIKNKKNDDESILSFSEPPFSFGLLLFVSTLSCDFSENEECYLFCESHRAAALPCDYRKLAKNCGLLGGSRDDDTLVAADSWCESGRGIRLAFVVAATSALKVQKERRTRGRIKCCFGERRLEWHC